MKCLSSRRADSTTYAWCHSAGEVLMKIALVGACHGCYVFYMHERTMKHPGVLLLESGIVLACGALLVALIVTLTSIVPAIRFLFEAHTWGPFAEELGKFVLAVGLIRSIRPSLVTLPLLGTAFGLVEAMRHLQVYGSIGFGAVAAHIVLGLVMTTLLMCALRGRTRAIQLSLYASALCIPAVLHLIYNVIIVPHVF